MDIPLYEGRPIRFDKKGYPQICINQRRYLVHVLVWEKVNGPKPKNHEIHHIDEDRANFSIENLECLTKSDHRRIHAGWVRNPIGGWMAKPCAGCAKVLNLDRFYLRKPNSPGAFCIKCHHLKSADWVQKNRKRRREINRECEQRRRDAVREARI